MRREAVTPTEGRPGRCLVLTMGKLLPIGLQLRDLLTKSMTKNILAPSGQQVIAGKCHREPTYRTAPGEAQLCAGHPGNHLASA